MGAEEDYAEVAELLGRPPSARFEVVVRGTGGRPIVIRNDPLTADGTPMPTRYWLVGDREREAVGRLESHGGVRAAEAAVDAGAIAEAHRRYATERDGALPPGWAGARPAGGVGGTRRGVKCLHAHLAWYLAGGADPVGRYVVERLGGELEGPVAAVDIGTNSIRLLVLSAAGGQLEREMKITRLGEGLAASGALSEEAVGRTIGVLAEFGGRAERLGAVRFRAGATAAVREASNGEAFLERARLALGVRPEVLSGVEEGHLTYLGATACHDLGDEPILVLDVGGGSSELVTGRGPQAEAVRSLRLGCVRTTETYLRDDPPTPSQIAKARAAAAGVLADAVAADPSLAAGRRLVAVAGTVAALAAAKLAIAPQRYAELDGARLTRLEVEELLGRLAAMPLADRSSVVGIEPARAEVVVGGAIVLAEAMRALGASDLVHSSHDLLDGLALSLLPGLSSIPHLFPA